jgi:hypothetical protein
MHGQKVTSYYEVRTKGHNHAAQFPVIQIDDCKGCNMVVLPRLATMYDSLYSSKLPLEEAPRSMYLFKSKDSCCVHDGLDSYLGLCMTNDCNVSVNNYDKIKRLRSKQRLT